MSPEQKQELVSIRRELNALWLRSDALARQLAIQKEPCAQELREAMGYISAAEINTAFALERNELRERRGGGNVAPPA